MPLSPCLTLKTGYFGRNDTSLYVFPLSSYILEVTLSTVCTRGVSRASSDILSLQTHRVQTSCYLLGHSIHRHVTKQNLATDLP